MLEQTAGSDSMICMPALPCRAWRISKAPSFKFSASALLHAHTNCCMLEIQGLSCWHLQGLTEMLGGQHRLQLLDDMSTVEEAMSEDVAVIMLTQVNYRSGRLLDMRSITAAAHRKCVLLGRCSASTLACCTKCTRGGGNPVQPHLVDFGQCDALQLRQCRCGILALTCTRPRTSCDSGVAGCRSHAAHLPAHNPISQPAVHMKHRKAQPGSVQGHPCHLGPGTQRRGSAHRAE